VKRNTTPAEEVSLNRKGRKAREEDKVGMSVVPAISPHPTAMHSCPPNLDNLDKLDKLDNLGAFAVRFLDSSGDS
jgi:hypothetical protein